MNTSEVIFSTFKWLDLVSPEINTLEAIATELNLPRKLLVNCLDPDYLPHTETYGENRFIVLRLMEPKTLNTADTVQELTTKIVLFITPEKIISIHRLPLKNEITQIQEKLKSFVKEEGSHERSSIARA